MLPKLTQSTSNHHLTRLYILSLGLIAILTILGQLLIQRQLNSQEKDVAVLQEAKHHQVKNQELSKAILAVQLAPSPELQQKNLAILQNIVTVWETPSHSLKRNVMQAVSQDDARQVERLYSRIEPAFQAMLDNARKFVAIKTTPSANSVIDVRQRQALLMRILAAEAVFARDLDQVLELYQQRLQEGINRLKSLEFILLGITLIVLVLEGLFVFKPAVNKLNQTLHKLKLEQEKSERLLLNILPEPIATRLKQSPGTIAEGFSEATVLFADIVGFTELSTRLAPTQVVSLLNQIFSRFDALAEKHGLEKIKTIGDAYMVVGGLPNPRQDHAIAVAEMALEMQTAILEISQELGESFSMRIGINSGPVVAGVIGIKKFIYDLWGDTVNIASRMESHGKPGLIQVSEATYRQICDRYQLEERGVIQVKGKGEMQTYWLMERNPTAKETSFPTPLYKSA